MSYDEDAVLNITVNYLDGTTDIWEDMTALEVVEEILSLQKRTPAGFLKQMVGIPIAGLRSWEART